MLYCEVLKKAFPCTIVLLLENKVLLQLMKNLMADLEKTFCGCYQERHHVKLWKHINFCWWIGNNKYGSVQLLWLAVIHFFFKESTGLPGILFTSNRHRICGNVKNVWFGTESSVKKKSRVVKVVIYFP